MSTLPLTHVEPRRRLRLPRFPRLRRRPDPAALTYVTPPQPRPTIPPPPPLGAPLAELVAHVEAIADSFLTYEVDPTGSYYLTKAQYDAYVSAIGRAQRARAEQNS